MAITVILWIKLRSVVSTGEGDNPTIGEQVHVCWKDSFYKASMWMYM